MKKLMLVSILVSAFVGQIAFADSAALKTDEQKISYALGQQIGQSLKAQGMDLDLDALSMSIKDVFDGKESVLSQDEVRDVMKKMQAKAVEKRQMDAEDNKAKGAEFLEENKKKEGVKVTATGLQYMVVEEAKGPKPTASDVVKVHYTGTLLDGTEFDSSHKRGRPAEFPLSGVIKGWTEGIPLMSVGSKYKFYIPSELGYGPTGGPRIPGNSVLVFDVELLEIKDKPKDTAQAAQPTKTN